MEKTEPIKILGSAVSIHTVMIRTEKISHVLKSCFIVTVLLYYYILLIEKTYKYLQQLT